jgi:hypothetical protein
MQNTANHRNDQPRNPANASSNYTYANMSDFKVQFALDMLLLDLNTNAIDSANSGTQDRQSQCCQKMEQVMQPLQLPSPRKYKRSSEKDGNGLLVSTDNELHDMILRIAYRTAFNRAIGAQAYQ